MNDTKKNVNIWRKVKSEAGPKLLLFNARYDFMENPRNHKIMKRIVLETRDWVNVVAITPEKKIVLVKQYRFGAGKITVEIPAGLIDQNESSRDSAIRELSEETGYTTTNWQYLGYVEPNPAFLNNRCHHWLAMDVVKTTDTHLDDGEDIAVELYTYDELTDAIHMGEVNHVLALSALSRIQSFWANVNFPDQSE
jgi:8-oxo-dGTP pyrophosphatase MutT (NUDIX family)